MNEEDRKARYEQAKARRRKRWAERETKRPPGEFAVYGLGSILCMLVFGGWWLTNHAQLAAIGFSCSLLVCAAVIVTHWRWEDTA